eukprot:CAMPEP_0119038320 /NCGR_PEP_ID=MMETSP1177-20130426/7164_1 /TAXON_ID=2985 /ORGANISM="Ochromonas sp, Strain CCMP1899" /LENGTH=410 /DNA_ID=CAMNT_0007000739 /DNA_START=42 /DNA_END=1271 /DNA_ORIENTATION=-
MSGNENFYICGDCKKQVPISNQTIHGVRCHKSRTTLGEESHDSKEGDDMLPFWKCSRCSYHNENMTSTLCSICDFDSENDTSSRLESPNQEFLDTNGWDCHICTFSNTVTSTSCSMCSEIRPSHSYGETPHENNTSRDRQYRNDSVTSDEVRPSDSVYRETLIGSDTGRDDTWRSSGSADNCRRSTTTASSRPPNDPYDNINRGILFGAAGGAGLAFLSGRGLTTGALSGAAYGALGGLLLNSSDLMNRANDNHQEENDETFQSSSSSNNARNLNNESSGLDNANLNMSSRDLLNNLLSGVFNDATMSSTHQFPSRGIVENDLNMDYHSLLSQFGNGNQQTPASERSIDTIPTSTFRESQKPNSSSDDKYKCFVCIDDFNIGEEISTLPCLHRFHTVCVNRWLRQSNTCP